jgi:hypothetical protein
MITLTCGNLSITLRNPDFGNTESIESRRIQRQTRGGDLITYRDSRWSKTIIIGYKITILSETELYKWQTFLRVSLGKLCTLVDYEGRTWQGVILTPNDETSQPAREIYSAGFQFQGEITG